MCLWKMTVNRGDMSRLQPLWLGLSVFTFFFYQLLTLPYHRFRTNCTVLASRQSLRAPVLASAMSLCGFAVVFPFMIGQKTFVTLQKFSDSKLK